MGRTTSTRNETKRMDALLALPLDRFRRTLTRLSDAELATLASRLGVQRMKHRLARGRLGIDRHRSRLALTLLARREEALRSEQQGRAARTPAPIQLVFSQTVVADVGEKLAA